VRESRGIDIGQPNANHFGADSDLHRVAVDDAGDEPAFEGVAGTADATVIASVSKT
jgi:hypothetical protein